MAPNPIRTNDVAILVGILAILEGFVWTDELPPRIVNKLIDRFVRASLVDPGATSKDLRQALFDLNVRLRYVHGSHPEPPKSYPVPD